MADQTEKKSKKKQESAAARIVKGYHSRLETDYKERILPEMMKTYNYKNVMQVPKVTKIVINMGIGEGSRDTKMLDALRDNLKTIAGQHPVITKAKKSISNFKLREGMSVGCKVTLRRTRMYDFLDRLMNVCIPRIRDFRGLSPRAFDGRGNYAMGVQEQLIFPEIKYDSIQKVQGMDIIFVTTAKTDEEALSLLKLFGMPFRN
ncbi:MAG: 50S ribosomal protein L5 [Candidatus Omnitrophota bacterium]|jgi:large subunit ribosomal protein L5|nr:MAG: 50S ribosomal protein L5 [Candidatus Omnitrophota bacterium]